jgi:hypothetical protein
MGKDPKCTPRIQSKSTTPKNNPRGYKLKNTALAVTDTVIAEIRKCEIAYSKHEPYASQMDLHNKAARKAWLVTLLYAEK